MILSTTLLNTNYRAAYRIVENLNYESLVNKDCGTLIGRITLAKCKSLYMYLANNQSIMENDLSMRSDLLVIINYYMCKLYMYYG